MRPDKLLSHWRPVKWLAKTIQHADMTDSLKNSTSSIGTVSTITQYAAEIENLLGDPVAPSLIAIDPDLEDFVAFALEKHLEDFLVQNWAQIDFSKEYNIFSEDGELVRQQYPTDTGPIDILAIKKDKSELLVVELKKGHASDVVVGRVLRYMGFVIQDLAETGQLVRGVIIALDDEKRTRRALAMTPTVDFYCYQVSFKLLDR